MFQESVTEYENTRSTISQFLGYNHNLRIDTGELYDMQNLTSDYYPVLSPRDKRDIMLTLSNGDWTDKGVDITKTIDSSIAETYASYSTEKLEVEEKAVLKLTFKKNSKYVSAVNIKAVFYAGDKVMDTALTRSATSPYQVTIPDGCNGITLTLLGVPISAISLTEEVLEKAVTNICIYEYDRHIRGMILKDNVLAYMVKTSLYYNGNAYDFKDYIPDDDDGLSEQQLISFGSDILIFPLGLWFSTLTLEYGTLSSEYTTTEKVTYSMCNYSGADVDYIASDTAPENPSEGDYWVNTTVNGLYQYSSIMKYWRPVATAYIKISSADKHMTDGFSEGDAVYMDSSLEDINSGSIIQKMGETETGSYFTVIGLISKLTEDETLTIKRKIPTLQYVCVSYNRVWGCYRGLIDGEMVNEIYASKLGDATNWYVYAGVSTDSYALSLGDDGDFTGAITYNGYPYFFKENIVYTIYGAYPAAYQLYTYNHRGVQKGCSKSLAIVDEYLFYKSRNDIVAFTSGEPESIYSFFGTEQYHDAVAGSSLGKYYISMKDEKEVPHFFVYDSRKGLWHKEDNLELEEFVSNTSGELYGRSGIKIYGFNTSSDLGQTAEASEDEVEWMAETGELVFGYIDRVYVSRISVRASVAPHSFIDVYIQYDDDDKWRKIQTLTGEGHVETYLLAITNERRDSVKMRLEGKGESKVYAISYQIDEGSDEE